MSDDLLNRALFNADGTGLIADNDQAARAAIGEDEAKGILVMGSDGTNAIPLKLNADGELVANIEAGDVEIGAVELKNATTDDRALISDANTARAATDHVVAVQHVDADGEVLDASDLEALQLATAAEDAAAPTNTVQVGGKYETTLNEIDSGDIGPLAIDAFKRLINAFYDAASNTGLVTDLTAVSGVPFKPDADTTLTAPGDGAVKDVDGYNEHTIAVTVVLNSCSSVVVRVDGSLNGTNYGICSIESSDTANVSATNNLVTIDADVTALLKVRGHYKNVKPVFVSEAGDTDSTVTFQTRSGN